MTNECIGLVLESGGARGAYECGAIKALYKHYPNFKSNLRVVVGASSGAFNAAMLVGAKGDPVRTLEQAWRERFAIPNIPLVAEDMQPYLTFATVGVPGMAHVRREILVNPLLAFRAPSICDNAPLHKTLADLVDVASVNCSPIRLIVAAADVETGELVLFENKDEHEKRKPFTLDMVLASGSIAPVFPMTSATEQKSGKEGHYWDGGFIAGLPLSPAINALEAWPPQQDNMKQQDNVKRVLIVVQVHPLRSRLPGNMLEIGDRVFQLLIASKLELDQALFDKMATNIDLAQTIGEMDEVDRAIKNRIKHKYPKEYARKVLDAYEKLKTGHKKIDDFIVIQMTRPEALTGDGNFSRSAIADRIECGYEDTFKALRDHGLIKEGGEPEPVPDLATERVGPEEGKELSTTQ